MTSFCLVMVCYSFLLLVFLSKVGNSKPTSPCSPDILEDEKKTSLDNSTAPAAAAAAEAITSPQKNQKLLDIQNFQYLLTPKASCYQRSEGNSSRGNETDDLLFVFLVHSSPSNFERRRVIRETWGSVRQIDGKKIDVIFLLGQPLSLPSGHPAEELPSKARSLMSPARSHRAIHSKVLQKEASGHGVGSAGGSSGNLQLRIDREHGEHGDLLQGGFADAPLNSSYKHLMGLKWINEECGGGGSNVSNGGGGGGGGRHPVFVIKTDDDVFVEIFHLRKFVSAIYGENPTQSLVCDVVPSGAGGSLTAGRRRKRKAGEETDEQIEQGEARKSVLEMYPEHCSRMAYLMTPDLTGKFLEASNEIPPPLFTAAVDEDRDLDDLYVTGFLREALHVSPFYLNLRYTSDEQACSKWLHGPTSLPLPYLFAGCMTLGGGGGDDNTEEEAAAAASSDWTQLPQELWAKTLRVHREGGEEAEVDREGH